MFLHLSKLSHGNLRFAPGLKLSYGVPLVPLLHTVKQTRSGLKPCFLCGIVLVFHTNISLLLRN